MQTRIGLTHDATAFYRIRIQGYLHESWADRMGGVTIETDSRPDGAPITVLSGQFQDQAALAGVLNTLYDLSLPLLSVECLGADQVLQDVALPGAPPTDTFDQAPRRSPSQ
jgi:hypothetical protein